MDAHVSYRCYCFQISPQSITNEVLMMIYRKPSKFSPGRIIIVCLGFLMNGRFVSEQWAWSVMLKRDGHFIRDQRSCEVVEKAWEASRRGKSEATGLLCGACSSPVRYVRNVFMFSFASVSFLISSHIFRKLLLIFVTIHTYFSLLPYFAFLFCFLCQSFQLKPFGTQHIPKNCIHQGH